MHVEAWGWCHCCSMPGWHLCRFLVSELRSSCLYGNCFIITVLCSRPECVYVWYLIPIWGNSLCTRQRVTTSQDSVETVGREPPVRLFGRQHFFLIRCPSSLLGELSMSLAFYCRGDPCMFVPVSSSPLCMPLSFFANLLCIFPSYSVNSAVSKKALVWSRKLQILDVGSFTMISWSPIKCVGYEEQRFVSPFWRLRSLEIKEQMDSVSGRNPVSGSYIEPSGHENIRGALPFCFPFILTGTNPIQVLLFWPTHVLQARLLSIITMEFMTSSHEFWGLKHPFYKK